MGACLAGGYSCCCCQCNFIIFPSPQPSYSLSYNKDIKTFRNSHGDEVPFLEMITSNSEINLIYFHGNAQDIGYSFTFLQPIYTALKANVFAIQYPTYGPYSQKVPIRISNRIKSDSLEFYEYLRKTSKNIITPENTIVIGRSIGSGGACYLAANKKISKLVLISPFSTIPNVARDIVGCMGGILKCHFDNLEEIRKYDGQLLVIHGKVDEVINYRHGEMVVAEYENSKNPKKKCTFISPNKMSHNFFDYDIDILSPIQDFVMENLKRQNSHSALY